MDINQGAPQKRRLIPAPRKVPFTTTLKILFGGLTSLIGWPIFGLGMIFFWVFSTSSELMFLGKFTNNTAIAEGRVNKTVDTGAIVNGKRIELYHYSFWALDGRYEGSSFSSQGTNYRVGSKVAVIYKTDKPELSKINGLQKAEYGIAVGLLPLIVPIIGLLLIIVGVLGGTRSLKLLKKGRVAYGRLVNKQATGREINDQVVYKMFFQFTAHDGKSYEVVAYTHETHILEDEEEEILLYSSDDPTDAAMFDNMPGKPEAGFDGEIKPVRTSAAVASLLVPILALSGNLIYIVYLINMEGI